VGVFELGSAGRPLLRSTAAGAAKSFSSDEACAGGVTEERSSTNLDGVVGRESGATRCGEADLPVCTLVLRFVDTASVSL
jgi:hypothetical protein